MTSASDLRSGKTHRDENFPVASWIIHPRHRALILQLLQFRQDRRRHRRPRDARRGREAALSRPARGGTARQGRHAKGGGRSAACAWPSARWRRAMRSTCWSRSGWTSPSCVTRIGTRSFIIAAIRPCRSAASCSTSTARAPRPGPRRTRCARACRSTTICRIAPRITKTSTASTCRAMRWPQAAPPSRCWARRNRRRRYCNACTRSRCGPRPCSMKAGR